MPLTCTRDDRRRRLTVLAADPVTLEDSMAFQAQQVEDGTWAYAVLYDGRARKSMLPPAKVRLLEEDGVRLACQHGPPGPLAILRPDDAGFGVGRLFEIISEGHRAVAVFRHEGDAERWLDSLRSESRGPANV